MSALRRCEKCLKEFSDLFSQKNEYVTTTKLRKFVSKVTQEGIENPENVTISGPASAAHRMTNQSVVSLLKRCSLGLEIVEYNTLSLNDIIKTNDDNFTKVSEGLDQLYLKAFPRDDKNVNNLYLHQLISKLTTQDINKVDMFQLFQLIQKMGYIPYAAIKEFGHLHIDHVPCIHLSFWPDVGPTWPVRKPRFWPNKKNLWTKLLHMAAILF